MSEAVDPAQPPPASDEHKGEPNFGPGGALTHPELDELSLRKWIGRTLSLLSVMGIAVVLGVAYCHVAALHADPAAAAGPAERWAYTHLALHAVVTGAILYFLYQLLRAGERMMIPAWWDEKPTFVALMLGIKSPVENINSVLDLLEKTKKLGKD